MRRARNPPDLDEKEFLLSPPVPEHPFPLVLPVHLLLEGHAEAPLSMFDLQHLAFTGAPVDVCTSLTDIKMLSVLPFL